MKVEFFAVSAQIMPVFFLAYLVEGALDRRRAKTAGDREMVRLVPAALMTGTLVSLAVVASGSVTTLASVAVIFAYLLALGDLLRAAVALKEDEPYSVREHLGAAAILGAACLVIAFAWVEALRSALG